MQIVLNMPMSILDIKFLECPVVIPLADTIIFVVQQLQLVQKELLSIKSDIRFGARFVQRNNYNFSLLTIDTSMS